ncbi:MAG TPA: PEP-CTERM sorting domain-containing protein, partial [Opitutaceae bacterium]
NASTIWRVLNGTNGVQGSSGNLTLGGGTVFGNNPLNQITFINHGSQSFNYNGLTTTWVNGTPYGWHTNEIRPTPEPSTYGAILLTGCFGFIGWRRYKRRKTAAREAAASRG